MDDTSSSPRRDCKHRPSVGSWSASADHGPRPHRYSRPSFEPRENGLSRPRHRPRTAVAARVGYSTFIGAGAVAVCLSVVNTWHTVVVSTLPRSQHEWDSRGLEASRSTRTATTHKSTPSFDVSQSANNIHWFSTATPMRPTIDPSTAVSPTASPFDRYVSSPIRPSTTGTTGTTVPHQVLEQYISWHSMDVVRTESHHQLSQRRYAVAFYSCPHQMGNRLHHFMNALLWSIVTNRTLLVHYWDATVCRIQQTLRQDQLTWHDPRVCQAANTMADCDDVLERAPWLSTYTEWAQQYGTWSTNLTHVLTIRQDHDPTHSDTSDNQTVIPVLDYWSLHSYTKSPEWEQKRFPLRRRSKPTGTSTGISNAPIRLDANTTTSNDTSVLLPIPKVDEVPYFMVDFPELVGKERKLGMRIQRQHLLATAAARQRAQALTEHGVEFLYGLLWKATFRFRLGKDGDRYRIDEKATHQSVPVSLDHSAADDDDDTYSIALHSRHRKGSDGTNIRKEQKCLSDLLPAELLVLNGTRSRQRHCHICLMSDRPTTLTALWQWIQSTYPSCTVVIAADVSERGATESAGTTGSTTRRMTSHSFRNEHGPNAGVAFIHELNICQHYTDGFIGTGRGSSSTYLLEEWIEYNHLMKQRQRKQRMSEDQDSNAAAVVDDDDDDMNLVNSKSEPMTTDFERDDDEVGPSTSLNVTDIADTLTNGEVIHETETDDDENDDEDYDHDEGVAKCWL